jgi:hypothetical protein
MGKQIKDKVQCIRGADLSSYPTTWLVNGTDDTVLKPSALLWVKEELSLGDGRFPSKQFHQ